MARSSASISTQILTYLQTNYGQVGQTFYYVFNDKNGNPITPSKTNVIILIINIIAWAINILEQLMDTFTSEVESIIASAVPNTPQWIQAQILLFQFGNAIELNSSFQLVYPAPYYPTIIQYASVTVGTTGGLNVKVAAAGPTALSSSQLTAFKSYLTYLLAPGQTANVITTTADQLSVSGTVFYNGQYNAVIAANVAAAITAYCASLPFNGLVKVDDIRTAIKAVTGVVDWVPYNIIANPYGGSSVYLVNAGTETTSSRSYGTYAGYITNTDTTGANLTFTVAQN